MKIENVIVHCSASEWGCAREIRKWHLDRGWRDIGYHFVILNGSVLNNFHESCLNGQIECGRTLDEDLTLSGKEIGAHALGYNSNSVGICLIGDKEFTARQIGSLLTVLRFLEETYFIENKNNLGHYEVPSGQAQGKTCPNINMDNIRYLLKLGGR